MVTRRRFTQAATAAMFGGVVPAFGVARGRAQDASGTPDTGSASPGSVAGGNEPLLDMLSLVPDLLANEESMPSSIAAFADIALRVESLGFDLPSSNADILQDQIPWVQATQPLFLPGAPFTHRFSDGFRDLFGWEIFEADQTLEAGDPPSSIMLIRGRFDDDALRRAWSTQGYASIDVNGYEVASLSVEAEVNLESDIGRIALARVNNAALLPDSTLVYTATLSRMEEVLATVSGESPSLGSRPDLRSVVEAVELPLSSAFLLPGSGLAGSPGAAIFGEDQDLDTIATEIAGEIEELGEMPPILLALTGFVSGSELVDRDAIAEAEPQPSRSVMVVSSLSPSPELAENSAAVAVERLESGEVPSTGRRYSELFASWTARTRPDSAVFVLELGLFADEGAWRALIFQRDLGFLAW